jgi:hypothetical protein
VRRRSRTVSNLPYPGASWQPEGEPLGQPHAYFQEGTAFHPSTGQLRVKGTPSTRNAILHPWLKTELTAILASLPAPTENLSPEANRARWESWRESLSQKVTLCPDLPPLRLRWVMDNLTGHNSPDWLLWCFQHGVLPLLTPLGGRWLNMAESIQPIIQRRA